MQLNGKGLLEVDGAGDVVGAHIGTHYFENRRLDVGIRNPLDVTILNILIPNLERL